MRQRPIEPLRAHAARLILKDLDGDTVRDLAAVVGDPVLTCVLIVARARLRDLLRDEGKDYGLRNAAVRILRALDAATRTT